MCLSASMFVNKYVYMCVCTCACVCARVYAHVHLCESAYSYMCAYEPLHLYRRLVGHNMSALREHALGYARYMYVYTFLKEKGDCYEYYSFSFPRHISMPLNLLLTLLGVCDQC